MNTAVKVVLVVVLCLLAVVVLFTWVFPWVEARLVTDPTLGVLLDPG